MSQLQLGLLILGGLLLLAMAAYNLWLWRKNQPRQAVPDHADETGPFGQEPSLDAEASEAPAFALPVPEKKPGLDALIDVIAPDCAGRPASRATRYWPRCHRPGGWAANRSPSKGSMPASEPLGVRTDRTALQPTARRACSWPTAQEQSMTLNSRNLSSRPRAFCDVLSGTPDFPDMRQEVSRARELDQFASDHDAQLGFVLRARRAAWSPSYVQQMAARLGFVAGSMAGAWWCPASFAGAAPVLSMSFDTQTALDDDPTQSALRELALSLDVPQVDRSERAFARMRETATRWPRTWTVW
jgi:hypothetical protein